MGDLSKLGIGLTVVFVLSLVALLTELCYIFFRRRKQTLDEESDEGSSRKLLCFLWCRNKSKIEPTGAPTMIHPVDDDNATEQPDELVKWQEMYGPSRVLFTIKEEEKEDLESEKSCSERKSKKGVCLDEEEEMVLVMVGLETPYYTPSSSPPREAERGDGCLVIEVEELQGQSSEKECFPVGKRGGRGS